MSGAVVQLFAADFVIDVIPVWKNCECMDGGPEVLILWCDSGVEEL